jgi:hypothetical protein
MNEFMYTSSSYISTGLIIITRLGFDYDSDYHDYRIQYLMKSQIFNNKVKVPTISFL